MGGEEDISPLPVPPYDRQMGDVPGQLTTSGLAHQHLPVGLVLLGCSLQVQGLLSQVLQLVVGWGSSPTLMTSGHKAMPFNATP